jgi:two-component system, sensor histidine kinase LadS
MRLAWVFALLVGSLVLAMAPATVHSAHANPMGVFDLSAPGAGVKPDFKVRSGVAREWGAAEIQAENLTGFETFNPARSYPLTESEAIWVQWRVRVGPDSGAELPWTLVFSKPFVDRVSLHYRDTAGQWRSQAAGAMIAHSQWPLRRLQPQLTLPKLPAGEHTLYLKVELDVPIRFGLDLMPETAAQQASQDSMLVAGLSLGLVALLAALCVVMTLSYQDRVFAAYSVYVVFAGLLSASYMGVGNYALWPQSAHWGSIASLSLSLLTMGAQLVFCSVVFLRKRQDRFMRRLVFGGTAYCALAAAMFLGPYSGYLLTLYGFGMLLSVGLILLIVVQALLQRSRMALWWLLSYVPLYVVVGAAIVEHLGIAATPWLAYNAPVYALLVEMLILMAALHQYGKARHAQRVRAKTLSRTEPGTGFLAPDTFGSLTRRAWRQAQLQDTDIAMAYVQVLPSKRPVHAAQWTPERALQRSAQLLHQVLRSHDWVCRESEDILAITMPGMGMGDSLTERFSRLVALGLMSDERDPGGLELRFRIAVGTMLTYPGSLEQLRTSLKAELMQAEPESQPPITYLSLSDNLPSQSEMDDLWEQALAANTSRNARHASI